MPLLVAVFTEQIGWKVGNSVEKLWMVLLKVFTPNWQKFIQKRQIVVFDGCQVIGATSGNRPLIHPSTVAILWERLLISDWIFQRNTRIATSKAGVTYCSIMASYYNE